MNLHRQNKHKDSHTSWLPILVCTMRRIRMQWVHIVSTWGLPCEKVADASLDFSLTPKIHRCFGQFLMLTRLRYFRVWQMDPWVVPAICFPMLKKYHGRCWRQGRLEPNPPEPDLFSPRTSWIQYKGGIFWLRAGLLSLHTIPMLKGPLLL